MKIWNGSSTERKKCIACGKIGGNLCRIDQGSIAVTVSVCDKHYNAIATQGKTLRRLIIYIEDVFLSGVKKEESEAAV